MTIRVEAKESDESKKKREELRRQTALKMLSEHICEVNKCSKSIDFSAEARFYLNENGFDYRKAADAYDKDFKYEQELIREPKKKKWKFIPSKIQNLIEWNCRY